VASFQQATYLGYQQITDVSVSVPPTLPVGSVQATGSACNLSSNLLTVGGTVVGTFATGQVVRGTGIPPNTYIIAAGSQAYQWQLSNPCTTETAELVTAYEDAGANLAYFSVEVANVRYLPGGVAPTSTVGVPLLAGQQLEYAVGGLDGLRFLQQSAGAVINATYYRVTLT
jgi:hypothetical protein